MLFLVCYDVSNERRLRKVAKVMLSYGNRVQKSIFECELDEPSYVQMMERVQSLLDRSSHSVLLYPLCRACQQRRKAFGCGKVIDVPEVFIV